MDIASAPSGTLPAIALPPAGTARCSPLGPRHELRRAAVGQAGDYFKDPAIWAELKSAHEKILKSFPDSSKHRKWYAKDAYYAGDYAIARQQFEIIGNEWHSGCWKTYNAFQEAKSKTFATAVP